MYDVKELSFNALLELTQSNNTELAEKAWTEINWRDREEERNIYEEMLEELCN